MNQKRLIPILIAFNLLLITGLVFAIGSIAVLARSPQVQTAPQTISYQGLLKDSSGHVYEGSKNLAFRIYAAETGGTELWEEIHLNVPVSAGAFAVLLGQTTTFPTGLFSVPDRWLEISVDGAPLSPRQKFTSAPYALNADTLDGYDSTDLLNSGSDELAPGAVVYYPYESIQPGFTPLTTTAGIDIGPWHEVAAAPTAANNARCQIWTGAEILCWNFQATVGAAYNPSTNAWRLLSTINAPSHRDNYSMVWSGNELIVWGGTESGVYVNTGARYNPATDTWQTMSTTNAPAARKSHGAAWVGNKMMIWGGRDSDYPPITILSDGGLYDPTTDAWTSINSVGSPTHDGAVRDILWTGSKAFVLTGKTPTPAAIYNPTTNTWTSMNTSEMPDRYEGVAWTGVEMVMMPQSNDMRIFFYNPITDQWRHVYVLSEAARYNVLPLYNGRFWISGRGLYDVQANRWISYVRIPYVDILWVNNKLYGFNYGNGDGVTVGGYHTIQIIAPYRKD